MNPAWLPSPGGHVHVSTADGDRDHIVEAAARVRRADPRAPRGQALGIRFHPVPGLGDRLREREVART